MTARSTLSDIITRVRLMIADPVGTSQQFLDDDIQEYLDNSRIDVRYEPLMIAPSIVNVGGASNSAQTIFADYYSRFGFWESDAILQGQSSTGTPWAVLTPVVSELLLATAHWQFELDPFHFPSVPGQYPPVFATGKSFDLYDAAASLLEFWAATLTGAYNITVDGQNLQRSQMMQAKLTMAQRYRSMAKPKTAKLTRNDVMPNLSSRRVRLLDSDDILRGA